MFVFMLCSLSKLTQPLLKQYFCLVKVFMCVFLALVMILTVVFDLFVFVPRENYVSFEIKS